MSGGALLAAASESWRGLRALLVAAVSVEDGEEKVSVFLAALDRAHSHGSTEGYRAGIEAAAKVCDEHAVLNDAVEGAEDMATDPHTEVVATACAHRAIEARECAYAIRALARSGEGTT